MQKSVLAEIIRSLNRKEIRDLNKWLQSPSHNQRQDVPKLFEFLVKQLAREDASIDKEDAWKAVFPKQAYDDAYMRQVMYFLLKAVEEFLVFQNATDDQTQYQQTLTRIYRRRKLDKAYKQATRNAREALDKQPLRNGHYLWQRYFLEQEEYERLIGITQNDLVNLQETSDALEIWFLSERLRIGCEMLAHRSVYQKVTYDDGLLEDALRYAADKNLLHEPAIAVFYFAYMAVKNPEEEAYFDELERLIHNESNKFTHSESRALYLAALNYCVSKINKLRKDFGHRAFELYRSGMKTGILLENNTVSKYTFGNAVIAALFIEEYDWAEQFIYDFQQFLDEKERSSIANFNLARVYFRKGDYDKVQRLLIHFDYDEIYFNIIAKIMLLKIYYEQGELDAFESLLESIRIYLSRKEAIDPMRKNSWKNMISLMKKLLHMNPYSKTQRAKLREQIESTHPLFERDWLLKQVDGK